MPRLTAAIALLLLAPLTAAALPIIDGPWQPAYLPELHIERARGPIHIDGRLDDAGWQDAVVVGHFAEHQPGDQVQPPFDTQVLVAYDDENFYVAFICQDDDPSQIRASFCRRDQIFSDDNVCVIIDTFGDATQAYEFNVNPYGIQGDLLYAAGSGEDSSYDTIFHTAARITDDGWQCEYAIPFSSLRFPDTPAQTWRVDFWRNHPRDVRTQASWAAYDRDEQCWPCQWGTVHGIEDVSPGNSLDLVPAFVASQAGERTDADGFDNGDITGEMSLTARYDLSSDLSAEATLNPDFSQVESDADQVDVNSNFALFYSEKRPFFQEGSDLWNTWFNAIYTRQINDPTAAGKFLGRSGDTSYGIMAAHDRHSAIILPFEERSWVVENGESWNTVARARTDIGEQAHVGVVATDRRYDDGGSGSLVGVDTRLRLNRNYLLELQYLHSFTHEPDDTSLTSGINGVTFDDGAHTADFDGESFDGQALYASLGRSGRSWGFDVDYWDRSATFRAENGFEGRNSYRRVFITTNYTWRTDNSRILRYLQPIVSVERSWNMEDATKDENVTAHLTASFRWAQAQVHAKYIAGAERYKGRDYEGLDYWHICANAKPAGLIHVGGSANYGRQVVYGDQEFGMQEDYNLWADIKPLDRLLVETSITWARSKRPDTDHVFYDDHIWRTKVGLQLTRELSLRLVTQYNGFYDRWEADPLVQYQINPLSIFYVGSTRDYHLITPTAQDEESWRLTDRQYFLKLQYLFRT